MTDFKAFWTPAYFGISFAFSVTGSNFTPPPPQGGTPVAAANNAPIEQLRLVA